MKKNILPVLVIGGLITVLLIFIGISTMIEKNTPSDERMNLEEYFHIKEDTQVAIVLNNQLLDVSATLIDGEIYMDLKVVSEYLNNRFYWDKNEKLLLYTTSSSIITAKPDASTYTVDKTQEDLGKIIVRSEKTSPLIHIDFIKKYTNIRCDYYTTPNRLVITSLWGDVNVTSAQENIPLRYEGNIKSPILSDVTANSSLVILEADDTWHKVATADGFVGYVEAKKVSTPSTQTLVSEQPEQVYNHLMADKPVNLLWHQLFYAGGNSTISNVLKQTDGITVMAPTWFRIKDNNGNLQSIASHDYVKYCHDRNIDVWGVVTNFDIDVDFTYIMTHTSVRQHLVDQLVQKAVEYKLDGLNIDFEAMYDSKIGDGYIQFLREISVACEKNNLVLSTDVPPVTSGNYLYNYEGQADYVDYVIVMAYDEHYNADSGAGSVSSLPWTENAIKKLLNQNIPANQIVLGIPFYTTLWIFTPNTSSSGDYEITYKLTYQDVSLPVAKEWMTNNVPKWEWLEDCGQYYGEAKKDGVIYKMWLEDKNSLERRMKLMKKYELGGAAYWKAGMESPDVWEVISEYFK